MAELSKIFKSNELYEAWRNDKDIPSNVLAVVLDETGNDVEKVAFGTNDITGEYETYEVEKVQPIDLNIEGCMFGDYIGRPLYDMDSGVNYPCDELTITVGEYGVTTYEGYIYLRYNRGLTEEEVTAEKAKITGDNIDSSNIVTQQVQGIQNLLKIIWTNTDENLTTDTMFINYDGEGMCSFANNIYTEYCNTAVIIEANTAQITPQNWSNKVEVNDIVINNQVSTVYHTDDSGEYHIMIMCKDYNKGNLINFPIQILFNNGVELVQEYNVTAATTFKNNGLRGYIFNIQGIPTSTPIDNIEIYFGNATYKIVFI